MLGLASLPLPPDLAVLVTGGIAVLARMSLLLFLLPGVGETAVPARIRIVIAAVLTFVMLPLVLPPSREAVATMDPLALIAYESVVGFALGFGFRVLVYALSIAGTIAAQSMSLSQLFGVGTQNEPNPTVSSLLVVMGTALFVTLDLHASAIGLLAESYELFPLGQLPSSGALSEWAMERTAGAFALGVSLALPFVLIGFLYNVVLGLMNQAMPQMMVTFVGVPANVMAGILLLTVALGAIGMAWLEAMDIAFAGFW